MIRNLFVEAKLTRRKHGISGLNLSGELRVVRVQLNAYTVLRSRCSTTHLTTVAKKKTKTHLGSFQPRMQPSSRVKHVKQAKKKHAQEKQNFLCQETHRGPSQTSMHRNPRADLPLSTSCRWRPDFVREIRSGIRDYIGHS